MKARERLRTKRACARSAQLIRQGAHCGAKLELLPRAFEYLATSSAIETGE